VKEPLSNYPMAEYNIHQDAIELYLPGTQRVYKCVPETAREIFNCLERAIIDMEYVHDVCGGCLVETDSHGNSTEQGVSAEQAEALIAWAALFEPVHQAILKTGAARCGEYDQIWHDYKNKVRPIIEDVACKINEHSHGNSTEGKE